MSENKKWFAVYTRPRWEKKVAEILTHKKIECYCPINKVVRQWSDRKKIVHEPLFTSYVFVKVPETGLTSLKQTNGVINLVYWLGKPAVIRDVEIEIIKRFLNEHINIQLEKASIQVNDKVRILGGPLMEMEGQVLSIKSKTIKVALPSLGYMMYAEVETSNVEVTKPTSATEIEMHYPLHAAK
jgi:transcription antitermination factor NusG